MGLLTIIRKAKLKEQEIRILVLGLDNAGKSSVLCSLLGSNDLSQISPTLGFDIQTISSKSGITCNLWDVGGQETIRHFWRNYFEETDGLLWVVDSADMARLEMCRKQLEQVLQEERLVGIPVLILANKQDLPGALSVQAIAQKLNLRAMGTRTWEIKPCSALQGTANVELLEWLVDEVSKRVFSGF